MDDFIPALQSAVNAGIKHFEVAGGARFQSPIFYCNENAFETMDKIRAAVGPDINLQSLARGVNVVGLDSQPRDIINLHAKMFKKHGVTTVRNFDALNDVNNLIYSGQCIRDNGLKHEVTITMMELPIGCEGAHDVAFYEKVLRSILDAGIPFDSLAFKDASGTSNPRKVYETLRRTREILGPDAHIRFHSHETAGTAAHLTYPAERTHGKQRCRPAVYHTRQPHQRDRLPELRGAVERHPHHQRLTATCRTEQYPGPSGLQESLLARLPIREDERRLRLYPQQI